MIDDDRKKLMATYHTCTSRASRPPGMAAPSTSTTTADDTASRPTQDHEPYLDISVLKDIARKDLVNALNSVSMSLDMNKRRPVTIITLKWGTS